ncbi:hypothetical protein QJS04_geneDACA004788 [Acorus gramineus]|uniref:Uncharacterized protein n=1 Tax=Acorus gramineus TaxID=55184 RepID=A0AAV9BVP9_ACOGR|nr:hypothetical protein QJS04_geneDACA004788 [Acorus gramineus]
MPRLLFLAEAKNIKGVRHAASRTRSDSNRLSMPSGLLCTLFYDSITGFSGIHSTISGYWIGPDVEDALDLFRGVNRRAESWGGDSAASGLGYARGVMCKLVLLMNEVIT